MHFFAVAECLHDSEGGRLSPSAHSAGEQFSIVRLDDSMSEDTADQVESVMVMMDGIRHVPKGP